MRRLLRLVSLDLVSSMTVEWRGGPLGLGGVSLSGDCARLPRVGGHSARWEESCVLPPVSLPKRDIE